MSPSVLLISILLSATQVLAFTSTTPGAITGALAGAGHSSVDVGESYILNPGTVAHLRGAAITMGNTAYHENKNQNSETTNNRGWHLSLNEFGADSIFATSIYISKSENSIQSEDPKNIPLFTHLNYSDAWFTLGNFVMPNFSAGISYHIHDTQTPLKKYQEHGVGLGFLWNPVEAFGLGFSIQNISTSARRNIPDELILGTNNGIGLLYIYNNYLRLRLNYTQQMHKLESLASNEWAFGLENSINPWILTRIGVSQNITLTNQKTQKWTFGMGFAGPRFGIHYAFQQYRQSQNGQEHSVDLVIPF